MYPLYQVTTGASFTLGGETITVVPGDLVTSPTIVAMLQTNGAVLRALASAIVTAGRPFELGGSTIGVQRGDVVTGSRLAAVFAANGCTVEGCADEVATAVSSRVSLPPQVWQ